LPRALNGLLGAGADTIFLGVGDLGSAGIPGFDFVNGIGFLERFYSVYDTTNKRVGLATTPFTMATTN
jgi:cathepsin E